MNDAALALRQVTYENRSFWRNPAAAVFTFVFPLMFMVIFNVIFGVFGRVFYNVHLPAGHKLLALAVALAVGAATFCAIGLAVTSLVPNVDAAPAVVNATIFPLLFISDVFIPIQHQGVLTTVA